jgi:hypothetical protein
VLEGLYGLISVMIVRYEWREMFPAIVHP